MTFHRCINPFITDDGGREIIKIFDSTNGNKNLGEVCSDRKIDRKPRPYPVERLRVLSRTISVEVISFNNCLDHLLGRSLISDSEAEEQIVQSFCNALCAANAAPLHV